jgi:hypothetical protein
MRDDLIRQNPEEYAAGQRAAEILRQHPELDAADASTFTGPAVDHLWAGRARRLREEDAVCVYGEQFGPPMPDNAA